MALRLQLDNGEIKAYSTYYSYGGGEGGPLTFESKCRLKDFFDNECDHLECAIDVTRREIALFKFSLLFGAIILLIAILVDPNRLMFWGLMAFAPLMVYGCQAYWSSKKQKELIEFKDYETINGLKAHKLQ